jgi:hypothetical protein
MALKLGNTTASLYLGSTPVAAYLGAEQVYSAATDTVLLLNFNGENNSTTFTDSSPNGFTVTANGDAQISTAQSKFGGASGLFDGNGDYLTIPASVVNVGTDDFTIEAWVWLSSLGQRGIIGSGGGQSTLAFGVNGGNLLCDFANVGGGLVASGNEVTAETWHHVAASRSGGTGRLFVDGVEVASGSLGSFANSTAAAVGGFADDAGWYFDGYIDDLRVTTTALYTANFTPPTAQLGVV